MGICFVDGGDFCFSEPSLIGMFGHRMPICFGLAISSPDFSAMAFVIAGDFSCSESTFIDFGLDVPFSVVSAMFAVVAAAIFDSAPTA